MTEEADPGEGLMTRVTGARVAPASPPQLCGQGRWEPTARPR